MKNQFSLKIELKCVDFFLKVLILTLIHPRNLKHLVELFVTKFPQPNTCLLTHGEKISWGIHSLYICMASKSNLDEFL